MVQLQYFNGMDWANVGDPWHNEPMAWASIGKDSLNYRTIDGDGNVLTNKGKAVKDTEINSIPRRNRIDLNMPAEMAIRSAINEVEKLGAAPRLTDVVSALADAKDLPSDYVDEIPPRYSVKIAYTKPEVIALIKELLERPDVLQDATQNENTDHDAESIFELALSSMVNSPK